MKRRLSTILVRCIKALLWLVWGSMAAAPAHAVTYLVMAKPGFNVKPQRAESLFELKLILFALKAEGVGLKTVVVTDAGGEPLPRMSAPHEHHLAHLWWAGVHPMLLSGSGKAYQTLRTLLAGYYAFELQLVMGGDCVGACIEKLELGEYGEREVRAMAVLLARRIERQDNVVAQAEEDQPEEEAAEGAEGEDDVGPAQAALAGQAVAVPATPGLPLAVATSSSGVSVPALPTASNTSMPAARALAGAMDAVAEAKREVKREDKQEVKVEAKMAAVPAPRMDTNIRVRELFPLLERRGWMQVAGRGRGSHRVFTNPAHPEWGHLSIPFHGNRTTFSAGLLRQVLLKARILQR